MARAKPFLVTLFLCAEVYVASIPAVAAELTSLTFKNDVLPILKARCFACHSTGKRRHGLDVRQRQLLVRGGDTGSALVPGKPEQSLFFRRATAGEMPPGKRDKVTAAELDIIRRWIEAGAPAAKEKALPDDDADFVTAEDREHWSFRSLESPPIPYPASWKPGDTARARGPVDLFLSDRLSATGLGFSEDAPRRVLIRRLWFDLLGLPPSPADVDAFLADRSPDAYERLVETLLASPRYGERWGRHWLDVAGYADSEGYSENDPERASAWRYRDYVVAAFNADKPYDTFLTEQLAGDEVASYPGTDLDTQTRELLTATGYLRSAADGTGQSGVDQKVARTQVIADTVKIFGSGILGLTLGCAQCHDHRYDPISQKDYHRIRAAFEPAFNTTEWKAPAARRISLQTETERIGVSKIDAAISEKQKHTNAEQQKLVNEAFAKELTKKVPAEKQELARVAFQTAEKDRTDEHKAILARYPFLKVTGGNLYQYNQTGANQIKALNAEIAKLAATKPKEQFIRALWEEPGKVPPSRLLIRGDPDQPADDVAPGALAVLTSPSRSFTFPAATDNANGNSIATSGRRTRLVNWLTEPRHPLTARVLVNRVWLHHFGRGLVATPGDFGTQGDKPSHPKLLDWLAIDFVNGAWSIKRLHRRILTSTAYRQSSAARDLGLERDPENRLLWRKPLQRLEGEGLRDAVLATTGLLSTHMGGAPVPVREDAHGRIVVGVDTKGASNRPGAAPPAGKDAYRRTLYVTVRRSRPLSFTKAFDVPVMETNCVRRGVSTIAPQALTLLNGSFVREQATWFARRLEKEAPDLRRRVAHAFSIAFGRRPSGEETERALRFLGEHTTLITKRTGEKTASDKKNDEQVRPEHQALVNFCQALINSSEFLFID